MKKVKNPQTLLYWKGALVEVVGIGEGKTIHMRYVRGVKSEECKACGQVEDIAVLEHSNLFQDNAEPVETVSE